MGHVWQNSFSQFVLQSALTQSNFRIIQSPVFFWTSGCNLKVSKLEGSVFHGWILCIRKEMKLKCPFLVDVIRLTQIGPNICKIPRGASKLFDVFIDVFQQHLKLIGRCRGLNPLHYFLSNLWDFLTCCISRNNRWVILIFLILVNRYPKKENAFFWMGRLGMAKS